MHDFQSPDKDRQPNIEKRVCYKISNIKKIDVFCNNGCGKMVLVCDIDPETLVGNEFGTGLGDFEICIAGREGR